MNDKRKDRQGATGSERPSDQPLSDAHLEGLGEALRQHYEQIKEEPVPESMKALLKRLRAIEQGEGD